MSFTENHILPLGNRVLLKISTSEYMSIGGIIIGPTSDRKVRSGEVTMVGADTTLVRRKQTVLFDPACAVIIDMMEDKHYLYIIKEEEILAIID
jgi:co-chaperonin GroES (HSP10)